MRHRAPCKRSAYGKQQLRGVRRRGDQTVPVNHGRDGTDEVGTLARSAEGSSLTEPRRGAARDFVLEASADMVQPDRRSERTKADMRIACLGGGPAGLYFAIAMKRRQPTHEIVVVERNRPYDTFGWGVVLSDETLVNLNASDPESAEAIRRGFVYWDDIPVFYRR